MEVSSSSSEEAKDADDRLDRKHVPVDVTEVVAKRVLAVVSKLDA